MPKRAQIANRKSQIATRPIRRSEKQDATLVARQSFAQEEEKRSKIGRKTIIAILIIVGLLAFGFYKKQWIIAATVNGSPVSNIELINRMNKQYREQTLNQVINEKIITQEASKKSIVVQSSEIDDRIKKIEEQVGGAQALDGLLAQQRQSREDLREQLRLQLILEKLYANEATVSAEEIDKFIEENEAQLQATESAKQKEEAADLLKQQKLSQIFNQKFQELKEAAKVNIF